MPFIASQCDSKVTDAIQYNSMPQNDVRSDLTSHFMPKNDVRRSFIQFRGFISPQNDVGSDLTQHLMPTNNV